MKDIDMTGDKKRMNVIKWIDHFEKTHLFLFVSNFLAIAFWKKINSFLVITASFHIPLVMP